MGTRRTGQGSSATANHTRVKINAEQQTILKEIIERRSEGGVKKRTELWSRHNKHFLIQRYNELLVINFQDAVDYLETLEIKVKGGGSVLKTGHTLLW